ncbi:MAG: L-ribulose-5-phosphate 3-epimerase [Clostridia bacterium]|nr:L-ribulose-5-phosphate 3-epimerase [Clostridia bacterium]
MKEYTLGMYEKAVPGTLTWKEKLLAAKAAGYDFVEISIDETEDKLARLDMTKQERMKLVKTMYEVGMPIRTLCLSGHRKYPLGSNDEKTVRRGMEIMEKTVDLADDLGIRIIMLAGYDVYYEESSNETRKRFAENIGKAVIMAAKKSVLLAFETMETDFMNTVAKSMKSVNAVGSPYLNIYPDIGNITNAAAAEGRDVLADLKSGAHHLVAMHLKETKPGIFRDMMFGEGHVDFESAIQTAWSMGVRRYVTEMWYQGNEKWEEDLKFAHDSMADILNRQ